MFQRATATGKEYAHKFTRSGILVLEAQGNVKTKKGWKILVIVEDVIALDYFAQNLGNSSQLGELASP